MVFGGGDSFKSQLLLSQQKNSPSRATIPRLDTTQPFSEELVRMPGSGNPHWFFCVFFRFHGFFRGSHFCGGLGWLVGWFGVGVGEENLVN